MSPDRTIGYILGLAIASLVAITSINRRELQRSQSLLSNSTDARHPVSGGRNRILVGCESNVFEFGNLLQRESIQHDFLIVNNSSNDVRLALLQPGCSCTVVDETLVGKHVHPGTSLPIPVRFDSGSRVGTVRSFIDVILQSHDTQYPVRLTMAGEVISDFVFQPTSLIFPLVTPGQSETQHIRFLPNHLKTLSLISTQYAVGNFDVVVSNLDAQVIFHAPKTLTENNYSHLLKVQTSSTRVPEAAIPMSAKVLPEITLTPEDIVIVNGDYSGLTRITLQTRLPAMINRVRLFQNGASNRPVYADFTTRLAESDSQNRISFGITNSMLTNIDGINVEVVLRCRDDRNEVRSAQLAIKHLDP